MTTTEPQARTPGELHWGVPVATIAAILLLLFVHRIADILLLLFVGILFSLFLGAITDHLERRFGVPRRTGLALALLATIGGVAIVVWLIVPPVLEQTQGLIEALPGLIARAEQGMHGLIARYPMLRQLLPEPSTSGTSIGPALTWLGTYFAGLFPYVVGTVHVVILIFSVLVMGIYLTLRPEVYRGGAIALVPPVHRDLVRDIFDELGTTLRAWIVGQLLTMLFLGVLTWVGLMVLRVPYSLTFGVFTALAAIVPFFGTLVSTLLPAFFVLGAEGIVHALLVVALGAVIHLIEANLVHPLIMERQVHLPPVLSILSVLVMAKLLGVIGLLVAVPVLATVLVIVRRIYVERLLEGKGFRRTMREPPVEVPLPDEPVIITEE
jgi:predicted PurR-regulated permease PerM